MEEYMSKGGMGMLRPGLFVEVASRENALVLPSGQRWAGRKSGEREVVVFWRENVVSPTALPDGFSLSEAVVISFERDRVVYRDFTRDKEGFYRRATPANGR